MNFGTRIVFVLDVSGSMDNKLETLNIAIRTCISDIPSGHFVGIVLFSGTSWIEHDVKEITDNNSRKSLLEKISTKTYGSTNIGAGLINGLTALTNAGHLTAGADLFLVTDGEHNSGPHYIEFSLAKLKSAKVRVNCIAYGTHADKDLEKITKETEGKVYFADDFNKEIALRAIETGIREIITSKEISELKLITVCDDIIKVNSQSTENTVIIDSNIGRNTTFSVLSTDYEKFSVSFLSPNMKKYDSSSPELKKIDHLQKYQLDIKQAICGLWKVFITTQSTKSFIANIRVTSREVNAKAIKLLTYLHNHDIKENLPPLIFVELDNINDVSKHAEVYAKIEIPRQSESTIQLNQSRNVFWAYFTDYTDKGRYNVTVKAKSFEMPGNYQFQRQEVVGSFKIDSIVSWSSTKLTKIEEMIRTKQFKILK